MSLNWKEINLILEELDLEGAQLQSAVQSAFDVIIFRLHKKGETKNLLISLSSGACRLHETYKPFPKSDKPLRFAQFLNSKIVNGWITEAVQLGDNRIVRLVVKRAENVFRLYIRLWSNAANFIVTDESGAVLDAMRRLPKRGEVTGGSYSPETPCVNEKTPREYAVRELPGEGSFNKKIDEFYAAHGGSLSLEALREQARRNFEGSIGRINAALERLREKETSFTDADRLKVYGHLILSNIGIIKPGDKWLETEEDNAVIRIELDPLLKPQDNAGKYYEQYRKAKSGLAEIQREIADGERELNEVTEKLNRLLAENNPLVLAKLVKAGGGARTNAHASAPLSKKEKTRPGLSFRRGDWLIIVGRDAAENDVLLRRYVKGNDLWLHARDYHGSYVFIKQRAGKTVPLEILLDAGNLAVFYSKGRNNGGGDLFYTQVKYLRRAKDGPKGLVIPTQEKNLTVKLDEARLRVLENCRVD
jgi:predicted ribosome quality control (RQC) complex YloA/Tae2 family protein